MMIWILYLLVCVRLGLFASLLIVLPLYIRSKVCATGLIDKKQQTKKKKKKKWTWISRSGTKTSGYRKIPAGTSSLFSNNRAHVCHDFMTYSTFIHWQGCSTLPDSSSNMQLLNQSADAWEYVSVTRTTTATPVARSPPLPNPDQYASVP